jgi:DNA-directed RNA polymerase subunit RPC12/RpoP
MIKIVKCADCKKDIEIDTTSKYKRKYCKECSKKRKEDYDNLYKVSADECEDA